MFEIKHIHPAKQFKRLHGIYHGIKKRCYNANTPRYKDYGGRGIKMSDEWLDSDTVHDRIFKRGWDLERALTEPSHALRKSLSQKSREHGLDPRLVRDRISKLGWSEEDALNTPSEGLGANGKTYKHTVLCENSEKNT